MRPTVVILLYFYLATASAGLPPLTQEVEEMALRLWEKYCLNGTGTNKDGNTWVHCKQNDNEIITSAEETVTIPSPTFEDQIVFIQPPITKHRHTINLQTVEGKSPNLTIFVQPSQFEVNVSSVTPATRELVQPRKPVVYYLKRSNGFNTSRSSSIESESTSPEPQTMTTATVTPTSGDDDQLDAQEPWTNLAVQAEAESPSGGRVPSLAQQQQVEYDANASGYSSPGRIVDNSYNYRVAAPPSMLSTPYSGGRVPQVQQQPQQQSSWTPVSNGYNYQANTRQYMQQGVYQNNQMNLQGGYQYNALG